MNEGMPQARVGIDIGGTFTDVALESGTRRYIAKVLTTSDDPAKGCMQGLDDVLAQSGLTPADVSVIIHGTTLATNALIERNGANTSLITTEGFRDTIDMGNEGRPEQYDINILQPDPLVPRRQRFTVAERLNSSGKALIPLTDAKLEVLLPALDAAGTESLAIGFIHSYADPMHEIMARDFFASRRPGWSITISSEVSPEFREFERFSTACANAYVRPTIEQYLSNFESLLFEQGFECPVMLMLSSGGLTTIDTAKKFPVRLVESGPAGGAIFAREISRQQNIAKALSFDMGGTTAKICLIDDGRAQTGRRIEVARVYRFRKDSGIPLRIPVIEMVEIGAGGGSVAWIDDLGRITVGPHSAGSNPGPACYNLGGIKPTVTDANLAMGRIDPNKFAGGKMPLAASNADRALESDIATPMSLSPLAAAFGVTEIVCENMATAARVHAIESGRNVDDRTLIAFGGGAPLHACQLAAKLGIQRIIIPRDAGVGSAVGFLRAPISYEVVRTYYQRLDKFDWEAVNIVCAEMEKEAAGYVALGASPGASMTVNRQAYMRYQGQGHEIVVDLPIGPFRSDDGAILQTLFDGAYNRAFGRDIGAIASAEIVAWSVTVSTEIHADQPSPAARNGTAEAAPGSRMVFDPASEECLSYQTYHRQNLAAGVVVDGPAIIAEDETSTVVDSRFQAAILPSGEIEMTRRQAG